MIKKLLIAAVVIAIAAVVWARTVAKKNDDPYRDAETVRVARRDLATAVKATGIVKPMIGAEVRVGSRVSGVVRRLYVRVGDQVQQGQLLADVDARDLDARRGEASAALEVAEANLRYAEGELRRKRELKAAQLIAPSEMDLAQQAFAVADRQRAQARATLDYATTQLGYARIVAPIAGVVESVTTQEGETVAASLAAPTFVTLVDLSRLEVRAYVDETDIGRIRAGQEARFTVDTYPDHEFRARVTAIYPQAEIRDNVVDYVAVLDIDPQHERVLRPEMTTTTRILLDTHPNVLAVPIRAVRRDNGRSFVRIKQRDTVEERAVTTGVRDESSIEIVSGLHEGDEVIAGEPKKGETNP